jgi:hypothetical protein
MMESTEGKMKKKIEIKEGNGRGLNLLVERDAGNEVLILTGSKGHSLEFWRSLRDICDAAVAELEYRIETE